MDGGPPAPANPTRSPKGGYLDELRAWTEAPDHSLPPPIDARRPKWYVEDFGGEA